MTLDEAIIRLQNAALVEEGAGALKRAEATRLGIEALKARKVWQDNEGFDPEQALPGETEE